MAKTIASVALDYNKAQTQANNLESIASQIQNNASKLEGCKTNIASAWKGDNANAYLRKLETVINNLGRIEKNIRKISSTVKVNSKRTYDAEVEAINTANKRTYK